jgi:hypothetical protein
MRNASLLSTSSVISAGPKVCSSRPRRRERGMIISSLRLVGVSTKGRSCVRKSRRTRAGNRAEADGDYSRSNHRPRMMLYSVRQLGPHHLPSVELAPIHDERAVANGVKFPCLFAGAV